MSRVLILALGCPLVMLSLAARPDDVPDNLDDWYVVESPEVGDQHRIANYDSQTNWEVRLDGDHAKVALQGPRQVPIGFPPELAAQAIKPRSKGTQTEIKVENGWIVSVNAGEFGGSLRWYSTDGKEQYQISDENIKGFVPTKSGLLTLEGLAHLGLDRGSLGRLVRGEDGRWSSERFVDLGRAPSVAVKDTDESLIVATNQSLLKVDLATKKVDVLLDHAFWYGLYPNSIVITPKGTIWLGMRHGVAKVEKVGPSYRMKWLVPSKAVADQKFDPRFE